MGMLAKLIASDSWFPRPSVGTLKPAGARDGQAGFTLLELLAVIALLGMLAGAAVMAYDGVQAQGRDDVTRFEMAQIREALLQFRRDSGSNDFPGQGIYDCEELAEDAIDNGGRLDTWPSDISQVTSSNKTSWIEWCQHPANFWMLFTDPLGRAEADRWDKDRKRGWNGPYLQHRAESLNVDNSLQPSGKLNTNAIRDVYGIWPIHDPFDSPFLLFDLDDRNQARLVSMGSDLVYDEKDTPNCMQSFGGDGKPLDYTLCLLR